jgi:hypothetical protein
VVVVVPGVLLAVVPGVDVVLVLGVAVLPALGVAVAEPMLLPLVLLPVVPLTVPVAVVLVAGTPLEVVEPAATVPTGHGFAVVAPPATEPVVPVVPGLVVVEAPTPVFVDDGLWVVEVVLAGVPIVELVLAGAPVVDVVLAGALEVVPVVVCGLAVPTDVGVPTEVGVPIVELPVLEVDPVVPVVADPGVAVLVPAAPVGLPIAPPVLPAPVVCATIQHEMARTAASKRTLRVRM